MNSQLEQSGIRIPSVEESKVVPQLTEGTTLELLSSSEEDSCDEDLHPVHFLPEGSKTLKEYENATKGKENRRNAKQKCAEKRTNHKPKLSDIEPQDLLLKAAEKGRLDLVEYSLDRDLSLLCCVDADGYTALHRAAYNGHIQVVRTLLTRGADVMARTVDGWQPLHCACRWGKLSGECLF